MHSSASRSIGNSTRSYCMTVDARLSRHQYNQKSFKIFPSYKVVQNIKNKSYPIKNITVNCMRVLHWHKSVSRFYITIQLSDLFLFNNVFQKPLKMSSNLNYNYSQNVVLMAALDIVPNSKPFTVLKPVILRFLLHQMSPFV